MGCYLGWSGGDQTNHFAVRVEEHEHGEFILMDSLEAGSMGFVIFKLFLEGLEMGVVLDVGGEG